MADFFNRSFFRRTSLLSMGAAFGVLVSAHASDSAAMFVASGLCFVSVGLMYRFGLPS